MNFIVGQKVAYPNHGVCAIESLDRKVINGTGVEFYLLRVLANNSAIFVPRANVDSVGLRPIMSSSQCARLFGSLLDDFDEASRDWKIRVRDYTEIIQKGDIFQIARVVKQLTYITYSKPLSFREQRILEKAKTLILSEMNAVSTDGMIENEMRFNKLVEESCQKHLLAKEPSGIGA